MQGNISYVQYLIKQLKKRYNSNRKLNINEMVQNKNLSKRIYDASWYELIRQLEYKSKWKN